MEKKKTDGSRESERVETRGGRKMKVERGIEGVHSYERLH